MSQDKKSRNNTVSLTTYWGGDRSRLQITKLEKDVRSFDGTRMHYLSLSKEQAIDLVKDLQDWVDGKLEDERDSDPIKDEGEEESNR